MGGRGANGWVGDRKGGGESGFGASDCRVVTLQEVVIDLAVFLCSGNNSFTISAMTNQLVNRL